MRIQGHINDFDRTIVAGYDERGSRYIRIQTDDDETFNDFYRKQQLEEGRILKTLRQLMDIFNAPYTIYEKDLIVDAVLKCKYKEIPELRLSLIHI